jgi:hypothetical protein
VLATMIVDPAQLAPVLLEDWLAAVDNRFLFFAFNEAAARSPQAMGIALRWIESPREWQQASGWQMLAALAGDAAQPDAPWAALLPVIERRIQQAPNFARYSMNMALIGIGSRPGVREAALAAAQRVGKVDVDHGDTACQTPVAFEYIVKMAGHAERRGKSAAGKTAKAKVAANAANAPKAAKAGKSASAGKQVKSAKAGDAAKSAKAAKMKAAQAKKPASSRPKPKSAAAKRPAGRAKGSRP